jgi:hypothetical protein
MKKTLIFKGSKRKVTKYVISALFISTFLVSASIGYKDRIESGHLDTAGMLDLVSPSRLSSPLQSDYLAAAYGGVLPLIGASDENVCEVILTNTDESSNIFEYHPYLISYLLAALNWVFPFGDAVFLALLMVTSLFSGLFFLYRASQDLKLNLFLRLFFLSLVLVYPVFNKSFLGQPFFDHLMFGLSIPLMFLVRQKVRKPESYTVPIVSLTVLLAMVSERGAALACLISFVYFLLLHGRKCVQSRQNIAILSAGATSGIWFLIWLKFFQGYSAYGQISIESFKSRLLSFGHEPAHGQLTVFFVTSLVFFLLVLASGRLAAIAVISLLPNILLSIGGAELTGFLTHYHQIYLPVVLFAALTGFDRVITSLEKIPKLGKRFLSLIQFTLCILLMCIGISSWNYAVGSGGVFSVLDGPKQLLWPSSSSIQKIETEQARNFRELIAVAEIGNQTVTTPEEVAPELQLSGVKDIEYWPLGMGKSEIVLAPFLAGVPIVFPFGDFYGTGETLSICVQQILEERYELKQVVPFSGYEYRIYALSK